MKIIADKEGKAKITGLCDLALKTVGMRILGEVTGILNSIEDMKKEKKKK